MNIDQLRKNVAAVRDRIRRACDRARRDPGAITVVVVTKTVGPQVINALADLGVTDIGENRVQDALRKHPLVRHPFRWHMIGHLQTNKVKKALEIFPIIHSLDRPSLARELGKHRAVDAYVELNVSGEPSKTGLPPDQLGEFLPAIPKNVRILGLMTMAPQSENPESSRPHFRKLRELAERYGLSELSMGMSQDFEVAIEEGATCLRIGTAFFRGV